MPMSQLAKRPFDEPKAGSRNMLLDYEKLADLADVFEPPEFPRMLLMAELNVISLLDKIRLCVESAEMNDAGRHVHTLGGLLGMYGMKSAARYVCQIELDPANLTETRLLEFVVVVNKSLEAYRAYRCSAGQTVSPLAINSV